MRKYPHLYLFFNNFLFLHHSELLFFPEKEEAVQGQVYGKAQHCLRSNGRSHIRRSRQAAM